MSLFFTLSSSSHFWQTPFFLSSIPLWKQSGEKKKSISFWLSVSFLLDWLQHSVASPTLQLRYVLTFHFPLGADSHSATPFSTKRELPSSKTGSVCLHSESGGGSFLKHYSCQMCVSHTQTVHHLSPLSRYFVVVRNNLFVSCFMSRKRKKKKKNTHSDLSEMMWECFGHCGDVFT